MGAAACVRGANGADPIDVTTRAATVASTESVMSADTLRTGWYSNQPLLDPTTVSSPYFGQLFDTTLDGSIYAQPLFSNGVLFVATENNNLYALDPVTGATSWSRDLGTPWNAADLNCADLQPTIGVTGTPAIDATTGTAYLFSKTYASGASGTALWLAHAVDLATGAERAGFPVAIAGTAANDPTVTFDPTHQAQRPGLLLMNGVVYAGFGAHCDEWPYAGWIVGVSTSGAITTMWTTEAGASRTNGGGIWQSGGGLMSDGDGQILFATGNDWVNATTPIAGKTPPGTLGEAVVRVAVQADGSLAATDFFSPTESVALNVSDVDLGSGAPVGLPAGLGTDAHPNLLAQVGKEGYLYLLDRDDLGGFQQGASGTDQVLQRLGPYGGVWSKPSVWPGDGGYVYVPVIDGCADSADPAGCLRAYQYGVGVDGATPAFSLAATTTTSFGYGSSAVVVTSDGTRSGSALLWSVWSSGWDGTASQLRAYDAAPTGGALTLRYLAGIGTAAKFTAPAVGDGRIYVGTRDGHVVGFGLTSAPPLRAEGLAFPPTLVGEQTISAVQVTVSAAVNVAALGVVGDFSLTDAAPAPPFVASAGATFSLPIAFHPTTEGPVSGALEITTDGGTFAIPLTGVGQATTPTFAVTPTIVTFAPSVIGTTAAQTVTVTNVSATPLVITGLATPDAPFVMTGLPAIGTTVPAGGAVTATITFTPTAIGSSSGFFSLSAGSAVAAVAIAGSALGGGKLRIAPTGFDLGEMYLGAAQTTVVQLANDGDVAVVIEKSKPPTSPSFVVQSPLDEGTIIGPGMSVEQLIRVSPAALGVNTDVWQLNADDGQGLRVVTMTVTGIARPVAPADPTVADTDPDAGTEAGVASNPASNAATDTAGATDAAAASGCDIAGGRPTLPSLALLLAAIFWRRRSSSARP
ncbi:MAG TPA: choice-of-anchor D domain-containing protein [Polyangia bacterium]|nr:choice-of-anchor D domain-containing protein [Polyangia bacterium]